MSATAVASAWEHAARLFELKPRRYSSPLALARHLEPRTGISDALQLIDQALVELIDGTADHNALMVFIPPQEGKLISDDTLVATPSGWTTHGALRPGDKVFHPSGKPVSVLAVREPAEASLIVRTSDYGSVKVHPRHEWTVYDRSPRRWRTVETAYLLTQKLASGPPGKRGHRYRFQLPAREPLDLPDVDLPIDPYTLGVWLGDGSTTKAAITHHPDDQYQLPYPQSARCVHATTGIITTYYAGGMRADLEAAGVYRNKHIPPTYLRASEKQRRALLAGLIDTDGHVSYSGQVSFDNADERLVRDTAELLRTLGYRAHVHRPTAPKLSSSGIQGMKPMWRVTFTPHDEGPARLERKAAVKLGMRKRVAITAIEPTEPVPGRCITVDSPDGLYLVGEQFIPTHNSQLCSRRFPEWVLEHDQGCRIAIVSYELETALRWGRDVKRDIELAGDDLPISLRADSTAAGRWETPAGGGVYSVGIGGPLTGRPVDLLVVDDPVKDRAEAESPKMRENAWAWWESVALTRLAPEAKVVLIQTRWHEDDLGGRIQARPSPLKWKTLKIPAIAEENDPLGRKPGGELVSVRGRKPGYFLNLRATMGPYTFSSLYQQSPSAPEGNFFHRSAFRYWRELPPWSDGRRRLDLEGRIVTLSDCWRFGTVDVAASTKTSADFTVISMWAVAPGPGYAVSDLAVQIKSIRRDEADKWELMGRRLTVPVVQEPGSACSITNA